jgi:UrcA family protein
MSRSLIIGAFALAAGAALPLTPAAAQSDYYGYDTYGYDTSITVMGPHSRQIGRSASGAPIELQEVSRAVDYSDLDLRTSMGRDELYTRVDAAARDACYALDDAFPPNFDSMDEPRDCRAAAVRRAQVQVHEAIDRANYYAY